MLYPVKDVLVWAQDLSVSIKGVFTARVIMNMLAIRYFFQKLETEESISEIDSHHILQEASER